MAVNYALGFQHTQSLRKNLRRNAIQLTLERTKTHLAAGVQQPDDMGGPWAHQKLEDGFHRTGRFFRSHQQLLPGTYFTFYTTLIENWKREKFAQIS
jgi:hypothetical protein